jgi:hypothetical protein
MLPVSLTKTGTGTVGPVIFDIFQNPFNVGFGVQMLTGGQGGTAIVSIEHTFDWSTVMAPNFNGLTAIVNGAVSTACWFPNTALNATTITATVGTAFATTAGNYAYPIAAARLNVISASATTLVIVNFLRSSKAP